MDLYWRPLSPPVIPPEHPYYSREDVRNASRYPPHIVAAGSYWRPVSPPPLCVDPKEVDPGYGFPKTEEERACYPLTLDYLSDPEPAESESSSSRASSATPSCSDVENVPIPPTPTPSAPALPYAKKTRIPPPPKKKRTPSNHPWKKKKTGAYGWGRELLTCKTCGTIVQARQMLRHQQHKHPKPGHSVPDKERTCAFCDHVFSRIDAMKRHRRNCTAQRP